MNLDVAYKGELTVSDPLFRIVANPTVGAKANNNIMFQYFSNSREGVYGVDFTTTFVIYGPSGLLNIYGATSCKNFASFIDLILVLTIFIL